MWKKLLIVYLVFGLSVAILAALSLYAFQRFNAYVEYGQAVDRNHYIISELNALRIQLTEGENNQRAFIIFNDSSFYHKYEEYVNELTRTFARIHHLLGNDSQQRKRLHALNISIKSQLDYLRSGMIVGYPVTDYKYERAYMDKSLSIINDIENSERFILQTQLDIRHQYEATTPQNFSLVFIFTLIIFCLSFFFLVQQYRRRINYQEKLEKNILELNQANSEWEQIAYIASHDLQEPLRKIRTFVDLVNKKHSAHLDVDGQSLMKRIDAASARAQSLMTDIVNYNLVVYPREEKMTVDLNDVVNDLSHELQPILQEKAARMEHEDLPMVTAYPTQMEMLFKSLIENSLKFSRPDVAVRISISSTVIDSKQLPISQHLSYDQYYKIVFQDNGIGFENKFSDKIFRMFQRLHGQESQYGGRGIGLAVVKRIMANHTGFIVARGRPDRGAKFTLYFPVLS
ncbi:MAG TPA: ATP-binding protein [Chryseosolibacter sp.]|nr:ATP-binding protein [Chryseosolibacter sp.]